MPQPNVNVINALFETYIAQRKSIWKLDELPNGKLTLPDRNTNPTPALKIDICTELLQKIAAIEKSKAENKTPEWLKLAYEIYDKEVRELKVYDASWNPWASNMLYSTLRACRSYILQTLADDPTFKKAHTNLLQLQKDAEIDERRFKDNLNDHTEAEINEAKMTKENINRNLASLKEDGNYLVEYYVNIIAKSDPRTNELKAKDMPENNIADFIKHAESGARPAVLCKQLLVSINAVIEAPAAKAEAKPAAAAAAAPAPEKSTPKKSSRQKKDSNKSVANNVLEPEPLFLPDDFGDEPAVVLPPKVVNTSQPSALQANSLMKDVNNNASSSKSSSKSRSNRNKDPLMAPNDNHTRPVTRSMGGANKKH